MFRHGYSPSKVFRRFLSSKMECKEIKIPTPWGHLAGKWWGNRDQRPLLMLHGWQDNCGTFDTLVPLLPSTMSFMAVDFPGHGLSPGLPLGVFHYNSMNNAIIIRRIQMYFGWEKVSLLGHSMGGFSSFIFASAFPDSVDLMVCFDFLKPLHYEGMTETRGSAIDKFLDYDKLLREAGEPPSYTLEQLQNLYSKGTYDSVNVEHAHYVLERNIRPSDKHPGKYCITRDPRQKVEVMFNYPQRELVKAAKKLTMPIFLSRGRESMSYERKVYFEEIMEIVRYTSSDFRYHVVPGKHHHHLCTPESVRRLVTDFLNQYYKPDCFMGDHHKYKDKV